MSRVSLNGKTSPESFVLKERPILFSGPMVRAILEGRKTQTRRCLYTMRKFSPAACFDQRYAPPDDIPPVGHCWTLSNWRHAKPGDRLWVREAFSAMGDKDQHVHPIFYRADRPNDTDRWTPSIHMPRWASRITLEITGVRVERLQDISEADCAKEGAPFSYSGFAPEDAPDWHGWYRDLWELINGPGSWAANPWVWVVEFKVVTGAA